MIFVTRMVCTDRCIVITLQGREPSEYWVVKNDEKFIRNLQTNQKHFFCFYDSDIIKSNEWGINWVQANFSSDWYYPGNMQ